MKISYSGENVTGEWLASSVKDSIVNVWDFVVYKECHIFFPPFFFQLFKIVKAILGSRQGPGLIFISSHGGLLNVDRWTERWA